MVNYAALAHLPAAQEAYCCLGTTIKVAGSPEAFRAVDLDAVLAFARAAQRAGATRLAVVSALGADPASRILYNRTKGEMEHALRDLGFSSLVIARPSLLAGNRRALKALVDSGDAFLGPASVKGETGLRACFMNLRTTEADVSLILDRLERIARELA